MRWIGVLFVVGCISPVMHFGGGKSKTQAQHDTLNEMRPAPLSFEPHWSGPVTDAKIRVYADDEYRTQNRKWREAFEERLDLANAVLAANFGVRLVADYREWHHNVPGATLETHIKQLEELDAGDGVLTVVGLTSSISLVSATFEELGLATLSGKHMMLRGYADLEERKVFANVFEDLAADERENALVSMRIHKNAAVFLHELGHNLGAEHETAENTLMNGTYSRNARAFSADATATITRTLDQRLGRSSSDGPATTTAAPAKPNKTHDKIHVVVVKDGAIVEGIHHDYATLASVFRTQAIGDSDAEIVVTKEDGVAAASLADIVKRLQATGFKHITIE